MRNLQPKVPPTSVWSMISNGTTMYGAFLKSTNKLRLASVMNPKTQLNGPEVSILSSFGSDKHFARGSEVHSAKSKDTFSVKFQENYNTLASIFARMDVNMLIFYFNVGILTK